MNPKPLPPGSVLIAAFESPEIGQISETLHHYSPTRSTPSAAKEYVQQQIIGQAHQALLTSNIVPPTLTGPKARFVEERRPGPLAVLHSGKDLASRVGKAGSSGALIDGGIAAAQAAAAYANDEISGGEALTHVGREALTGGASATVGTLAVAALVVVTGPVSAPVAGLIGTAAALGTKLGLSKALGGSKKR